MASVKSDQNTVDALWIEFGSERSTKAREALTLAYMGLVKFVASRLAARLPGQVDVDDLFGAGFLGLMQAIDKFEPTRNVKFETYAVRRIRGAMLDEMRCQDWFPRSLRKKAKELERACAEVEARLGRPATDGEIAEHLQIPLADYYDLVDEVSLTTLISIDKEIAGCNESFCALLSKTSRWEPTTDPVRALEERELNEIVRQTVIGLPERERTVLWLYYYEELTLKGIGEVMGISESRVCQLHTKAVVRLRSRLACCTRAVPLSRLAPERERAREKKTRTTSRVPRGGKNTPQSAPCRPAPAEIQPTAPSRGIGSGPPPAGPARATGRP